MKGELQHMTDIEQNNNTRTLRRVIAEMIARLQVLLAHETQTRIQSEVQDIYTRAKADIHRVRTQAATRLTVGHLHQNSKLSCRNLPCARPW